jgi:hypothetical protein
MTGRCNSRYGMPNALAVPVNLLPSQACRSVPKAHAFVDFEAPGLCAEFVRLSTKGFVLKS